MTSGLVRIHSGLRAMSVSTSVMTNYWYTAHGASSHRRVKQWNSVLFLPPGRLGGTDICTAACRPNDLCFTVENIAFRVGPWQFFESSKG